MLGITVGAEEYWKHYNNFTRTGGTRERMTGVGVRTFNEQNAFVIRHDKAV